MSMQRDAMTVREVLSADLDGAKGRIAGLTTT